jgi:hypothetical protein
MDPLSTTLKDHQFKAQFGIDFGLALSFPPIFAIAPLELEYLHD